MGKLQNCADLTSPQEVATRPALVLGLFGDKLVFNSNEFFRAKSDVREVRWKRDNAALSGANTVVRLVLV